MTSRSKPNSPKGKKPDNDDVPPISEFEEKLLNENNDRDMTPECVPCHCGQRGRERPCKHYVCNHHAFDICPLCPDDEKKEPKELVKVGFGMKGIGDIGRLKGVLMLDRNECVGDLMKQIGVKIKVDTQPYTLSVENQLVIQNLTLLEILEKSFGKENAKYMISVNLFLSYLQTNRAFKE